MVQMCGKTSSGDLRLADVDVSHAHRSRPDHIPMPGPSSVVGNVAALRSPDSLPIKQRVSSQPDALAGSSATSPAKQPGGARRSSIWDSFFQYDITYQGTKKK